MFHLICPTFVPISSHELHGFVSVGCRNPPTHERFSRYTLLDSNLGQPQGRVSFEREAAEAVHGQTWLWNSCISLDVRSLMINALEAVLFSARSWRQGAANVNCECKLILVLRSGVNFVFYLSQTHTVATHVTKPNEWLRIQMQMQLTRSGLRMFNAFVYLHFICNIF